MMELYNGRPETNDGRLEKEIKVYDFLDDIGVPFVRVDHEAVMTFEACKGIDETLGITINKNLFLCNRQKTAFYLLLLPGEKALKVKELSAQIPTSRLSFGSGEAMEELLNVTPGSATVMGLLFDPEHKVQLLIDEEILKDDFLGCHPCINTSSIRFTTKDFMEKIVPALGHDYILVNLTDGNK